MTPAEERELMAFASERLAQGMSVCLRFSLDVLGPRFARREDIADERPVAAPRHGFRIGSPEGDAA